MVYFQIMKTLLTLYVLLFSSSLIAETYVCSMELSRWNRAGEIETKTLKRNGNLFLFNGDWEFDIVAESQEQIILFNYLLNSNFATYTIMLNKKTLEFTENYMSIEDSKENESEPLVYGKCIIIND